MDFATAISKDATVEHVLVKYAHSFVCAVAKDPENWLDKVSHNFVGQCFEAMGLKFIVSVEEFQETYDHPYRNDNLSYINNPAPFILEGVELFMEYLPYLLARHARTLAVVAPNTALGERFYELTHPIFCYLRVLSVWTKVVYAMSNNLQLESAVDKVLFEPVVRLSLSLLHGLLKLLPEFGEQFEDLKILCIKLAEIVRCGIIYETTFRFILGHMLDIFNEHFELFCNEDNLALKFIYDTLSKTADEDILIQLYGFLESMMTKLMEGQQRDEKGNLYLRIFINELSTDKYLHIQFEGLRSNIPNGQLKATLQYLQTLQCHLKAHVFKLGFLEQILRVLLHGSDVSSSVCSLATELYLTQAQRVYSKLNVLAHILVTFMKTKLGTVECYTYQEFIVLLKDYLLKIMEHFPTMRIFKSYFTLLAAKKVQKELHIFTAQAMCALFELFTEQYADQELARTQLHELLDNLPCLIEKHKRLPEVRTILFCIYSAVDFRAVVQQKPEMICKLELYFFNVFLYERTPSDSDLLIFPSLCRSFEVTGNDLFKLRWKYCRRISKWFTEQEPNALQP